MTFISKWFGSTETPVEEVDQSEVEEMQTDIATNQNHNEIASKTKELCRISASKYKKSSAFKKHSLTAYRKSLMHGWLEEFFPDEIHKTKTTGIRSQILDYVATCGHPVTKKEVQIVMLEIAGQPLDRWEYGVSYIDNVSLGNTVFAPSISDHRYLKAINRSKPTLYQITEI